MQLFSIQQLNKVFGQSSLFHYYCEESNVIEIITKKFLKLKATGQLNPDDRYFPLQILNPDQDNNTAIRKAVNVQNFKTVDCMMQLLVDFPEICLSKMIMKQLKELIDSGLLSVFNFFDQKTFQPPQMELVFQIPWEDDEELIFASHTSIVSYDLLIHYGLVEAR